MNLKYSLAAFVAVVSATAANAADLPARTYGKAAAPDYIYDWSGFYAGVNVGGASSHAQTQYSIAEIFGLGAIDAYNRIASPAVNKTGLVGGGQFGYNYQISPSWLVGLEADIDGMKNDRTVTTSGTPPGHVNLVSMTNVSTNWLATFRGRIGWVSNDWLIYGTGGLAVTDIRFSQTNTYTGPGPETASASGTKAGWTIGGGFEHAFAANWTVKTEYLYARFDGVESTTFNGPPNFLPAGFFGHAVDHLDIQTVRVGLNYKFGGPILASH